VKRRDSIKTTSALLACAALSSDSFADDQPDKVASLTEGKRYCTSNDGARHSGKSDGILCKRPEVKYVFIQRHRRI